MASTKEIIDIVKQITQAADIDSDTELIESEILDSFAIAALVEAIQKQFDITVETEDLLPENFESADKISEFVNIKIG